MDQAQERRLPSIGSCADSFHRVHTYFSADLIQCPDCGCVWLAGYYEAFDFADDSQWQEWGRRVWIYRPLSAAQVAEVKRAAGSGELDLDTFAAT